MAEGFLNIDGYEPEWYRGHEIASHHHEVLAMLPGRRLRDIVLLDDGDGDWRSDAPVVLSFDGLQLEACHNQLDLFALSVASIDLSKPVVDGDWTCTWRSTTEVQAPIALPAQVTAARFVRWQGDKSDLANGGIALHLELRHSPALLIANGLDENQLEFGPLDERYSPVSPKALTEGLPSR